MLVNLDCALNCIDVALVVHWVCQGCYVELSLSSALKTPIVGMLVKHKLGVGEELVSIEAYNYIQSCVHLLINGNVWGELIANVKWVDCFQEKTGWKWEPLVKNWNKDFNWLRKLTPKILYPIWQILLSISHLAIMNETNFKFYILYTWNQMCSTSKKNLFFLKENWSYILWNFEVFDSRKFMSITKCAQKISKFQWMWIFLWCTSRWKPWLNIIFMYKNSMG